MHHRLRSIFVGLALTLSACRGSGISSPAPAALGATSTPVVVATPAPGATIDPTRVPSGDGKTSATTPAQGWILACTTNFNGQGSAIAGPWINANASGTWDSTAKIAVQGSVSWPAASISVSSNGMTRTIVSNDLPKHTTGTFPIAASDPAFKYDGNPGSIAANAIGFALPANPVVNATPACTSLGPIGIMLSGPVFFNALDALGRDGAEHELQDACQGHPAGSLYHYHTVSSCLADPGNGHSALLGYARDGFGIFGNRGTSGQSLTNADLDVCHGHTHSITWDGQTITLYHYHATKEYPYTVGCYRGTPV